MSTLEKTEKKVTRGERSELKGRLRSLLMFLPNMVMLLGRLLKDARVPTAEKALFMAAIRTFFRSSVRSMICMLWLLCCCVLLIDQMNRSCESIGPVVATS